MSLVWPLSPAPARPLSPRDVLTRPLPHARWFDRLLIRALALVACRRLTALTGLERLVAPGPVIFALNHNTRSEALLVPALLILLRGGAPVRFLADWNFQLIPFVNLVYRRAGVITLTRKRAKPDVLTPLRALFRSATPVLEQAKTALARGEAVGIFVEGTVNRDPCRLKRGRRGAAQLSRISGVPVLPIGLVHEGASDHAPFALHAGAPVAPGQSLSAHHAAVMSALSRLSGKSLPHTQPDGDRP